MLFVGTDVHMVLEKVYTNINHIGKKFFVRFDLIKQITQNASLKSTNLLQICFQWIFNAVLGSQKQT